MNPATAGSLEDAVAYWHNEASQRHNNLHYTQAPVLWRYFQMLRNHVFTRDYEPDLSIETSEPDVYKAVPLYTFPMLQQSRRMVELGASFSFFPDFYPDGSPWRRSKHVWEGVISTRILLTVCKLLGDFCGVQSSLTSVDIRDGTERYDIGEDEGTLLGRVEALLESIGLRQYWRPYMGIGTFEWLADEAGRLQRGEVQPIDFLLIDANHTYGQVKGELEGALPLMSERGMILIDDSYITAYTHHDERIPAETEEGLRHGGEYGAIIEFIAEHPEWQPEWLQFMCLLRRG